MDPALQGIHDSMQRNAALFLRRSVEEMLRDDGDPDDPLSHDAATMSCTLLQLSIELFLKAAIIRGCGLPIVADPRRHKDRTLAVLLVKCEKQTLHTKSFEDLKHVFRRSPQSERFSETDWTFIDEFQRLRNKLVHVGYEFHANDLIDLRIDTVYVISHTVASLMTDDDARIPSEVLEPFLGAGMFKRLISYAPYVEHMTSLVRDLDGRTLRCWECDKPTFSQVEKRCFCCCHDWSVGAGFADCIFCESPKSVVFDTLNIEEAEPINGLCLACGQAGDVVRCTECRYASEIDYSQFGRVDQMACEECGAILRKAKRSAEKS